MTMYLKCQSYFRTFSSSVLLLGLMSTFFLNLLGYPILSVKPDDDEDLSSFLGVLLTSLSFDLCSLFFVVFFLEKSSFGSVADSCSIGDFLSNRSGDGGVSSTMFSLGELFC